jgi:hypothetical protein
MGLLYTHSLVLRGKLDRGDNLVCLYKVLEEGLEGHTNLLVTYIFLSSPKLILKQSQIHLWTEIQYC